MRIVVRLIGFVVFALVAQLLCYISRIPMIQDITLFSYPCEMAILTFLVVAAVWLVVDLLAAIPHSLLVRNIVFWTLMASFLAAAIVVPILLTKRNPEAVFLTYIVAPWIVTTAVYWLIAGKIAKLYKKRIVGDRD